MVELKSTKEGEDSPIDTHQTSAEGSKEQPENGQLVGEYKDLLQRIQADFENYKKRTEREKQEIAQSAKTGILKKLLNTYDDFERALEHVTDSVAKEAVEMMFKNFKKVLEEEGVRPIEAKGKKLDPYRHEVMTQTEGEDDDVVVEEFQKGYLFHNHVLRTSKVRISKKSKED